jgi:hypothetical protein
MELIMFTTEEERKKHLSCTNRMVEEFQDELLPTLFTDLDGKPSVLIVPFPDSETKDGAKAFLMKLIREKRITGFCFICESYMTKIPQTSKMTPEDIIDLPPKERPDTNEIIMVQFCNAKETYFYIANIEKTAEGKRTLGEWEHMKDCSMGGRFGNIWSDAISICN